MARRFKNTDNVIEALIRSMIEAGTYAPKTIAHTSEHCCIVSKEYLGDRSLYDLTAEDVRLIHSKMVKDGLAVATQKNYIGALRTMLKFLNNPAGNTKILFQADIRPCTDWLTPEEARTVLNYNFAPKQKLIIVLALCMGLRRIEIIRLKLSDIDYNRQCITVTGKGRAGGKLRLVPFHDRFTPALDNYLKQRVQITNQSKKEAPDNLIIWYDRPNKTALAYNQIKGSGMDKLIRSASVSVKIHFSAHTLRRTFGRIMWLSGVPVVTIAKLLGHSSTEQTLQYIGANLDDMAGAMKTFNLK